MTEQPQGYYPRINGKMLKSGDYNGQLVSLIGKFGSSQPNGTVDFSTCDSMTISLSTEFAPVPDVKPEPPAVEVVGQVVDGQQPVMVRDPACQIE